MTEPLVLALILACVFFGSLLQGSVGIGLGIFAAPLVALLDPRYLPGPMLSGAMVLALLMALRERHALAFRSIAWALVGRAPGVLIGAALLAAATAQWLDVLLGGLMLVCVLLSVSKLHLAPTPHNLFAAGVLSGIAGTATSVGGPPIALVLQREMGPKVRATLSGYFVIGCVFSISVLAAIGRFGAQEVALSLRLLPAVLVGFLLSAGTRAFFDRGFVRPTILAVSGAAAAFVLARGVWGLWA